MRVRAQIASVFHLDKCIGCHTCSIACKNIWTDRQGAEYMWWNNVETKPGTGYPMQWEAQDKYHGGWEKNGDSLRLKMGGKPGILGNIFHNPNLPSLNHYYEPWTYEYGNLFSAPEGDDQPVARPVSMITGKAIDVQAGPNWDDDLGGSGVYAANDPGVLQLSAEQRKQLFEIERLVFFYLPRFCNHCVNPACVAACPSGAIYKRGEDGVVLVNQDKCRSWRMCVSACPYKKVYYNWSTGKSEKCVFCYPRQECGEAPACFHSCVGRIRYLGVLLYDADRIEQVAKHEERDLVEAQRSLILDPNDPAVICAARDSGVDSQVMEAARRSPVYRFVKEWEIALPLHPEFRTLPMLFYVPPLLPVLSMEVDGTSRVAGDFFSSLENARLPIQYLAGLFGGGNQELVKAVYRKLIAVRLHRRGETVGDVAKEELSKVLKEAGMDGTLADQVYRMTSLTGIQERFVIPSMLREQAIEMLQDTGEFKGEMGLGPRSKPERRW